MPSRSGHRSAHWQAAGRHSDEVRNGLLGQYHRTSDEGHRLVERRRDRLSPSHRRGPRRTLSPAIDDQAAAHGRRRSARNHLVLTVGRPAGNPHGPESQGGLSAFFFDQAPLPLRVQETAVSDAADRRAAGHRQGGVRALSRCRPRLLRLPLRKLREHEHRGARAFGWVPRRGQRSHRLA